MSPALVICYCITNYPELGGFKQHPFSGNLLQPARRAQLGNKSSLARGLRLAASRERVSYTVAQGSLRCHRSCPVASKDVNKRAGVLP